MMTDYSHQTKALALSTANALGQFIYPTGTGKTLIEAHIISKHIQLGDNGIYVILVPRIVLAQQLFVEIHREVVQKQLIDCHFFSCHSGRVVTYKDVLTKKKKTEEDRDDNEDLAQQKAYLLMHGIDPTRNFESGTTKAKINHAIARATKDAVPLIIVATYHSMQRLAGVPISVLLADEAHHLVSEAFAEGHQLNAMKRFYFTATRRITAGGRGRGMNNSETWGQILDSLSGVEAVLRKLIVRPRLHFVKVEEIIEKGNEYIADSVAIEQSLERHGMMTRGIGAKLLIATRGTKHLKDMLTKTRSFEQLRSVRPRLQVFSIISGKNNAQINGVVVTREEWMKKLRELRDDQEAIILHYDILSEGLDVPGITGIMPLRGLGIGKFLQMLGRASRLHDKDRVADIDVTGKNWSRRFVKPYAWVIIPCYGADGDDNLSSIEEYIHCLREFGWTPEEDVIISSAGDDEEPKDIETLHVTGRKLPKQVIDILTINQKIEDAEQSARAYEDAKKMTKLQRLSVM